MDTRFMCVFDSALNVAGEIVYLILMDTKVMYVIVL